MDTNIVMLCSPRGGGLADGKPRAQNGKTPLHEAAGFSKRPFHKEKSHEAVVGALLKAGADKDAKDKASWLRVMGESITSLRYVRIWIWIGFFTLARF